MNSKVVLLAAAVCFAVICSVSASHEFKCQKKALIMTEDQKTNLKTCKDEWAKRHPNAGDKEHPWTENCFIACKFTKSKWAHDGKFDVEAAKKDMVAMVHDIPTDSQDKIKKAFDECAKAHTETLSTDKDCESYSKIGKCIFGGIYKICNDKED